MDEWRRRVSLEGIIYKMFRGVELNSDEKRIVERIVEVRDYGRVLG